PLAHQEACPGRKMIAIQIKILGSETRLEPCWRIQTQRLVQNPICIRHLLDIFQCQCATSEYCTDVIQQFLAYLWMLRNQVERPGKRDSRCLMTGGNKGRDMIVHL